MPLRTRINELLHKWFRADTAHDHEWTARDRRGNTFCARCGTAKRLHITQSYDETEARRRAGLD